ncbi:MAG: hypothetical protein AAF357_13845, partial [Verrucomicrobiota bacterium]
RKGGGNSSLNSNLAERTQALAEYSRSSTWGDAAIRIALSFGIAMIFASLLRAFLKSMVLIVIVAAVVCWFLHLRGLIDPFWEDFAFSAVEAKAWASSQFKTMKGFVGGVLPSSGAALAGFLFGLRK